MVTYPAETKLNKVPQVLARHLITLFHLRVLLFFLTVTGSLRSWLGLHNTSQHSGQPKSSPAKQNEAVDQVTNELTPPSRFTMCGPNTQ